jgi:hypothetical protein
MRKGQQHGHYTGAGKPLNVDEIVEITAKKSILE